MFGGDVAEAERGVGDDRIVKRGQPALGSPRVVHQPPTEDHIEPVDRPEHSGQHQSIDRRLGEAPAVVDQRPGSKPEAPELARPRVHRVVDVVLEGIQVVLVLRVTYEERIAKTGVEPANAVVVAHHGVVGTVAHPDQVGCIEVGEAEVGVGDVRTGQNGPAEIGLAQIGSREIGLVQVRLIQAGSTQVGFMHIHLSQIRLGEIDPGKKRLGEVGFIELGLGESRAGKVSPPQDRHLEIGFTEVGVETLGARKIGLAEIDTAQIEIRQVGSGQLRLHSGVLNTPPVPSVDTLLEDLEVRFAGLDLRHFPQP